MRIGIIMYNYEPNVGSSIALGRLKSSLESMSSSSTIDLINVTKNPSDVEGCINHVVTTPWSGAEYDHLLINEPTYDVQNDWVRENYIKLLNSITASSRSLWLQGEYTTITNVDKMMPFYEKVLPTIQTIYTIAPALYEVIFKNIIFKVPGLHPGLPEISMLPGCGILNTEPTFQIGEKYVNRIGYCARVTSMKKPVFFVRLMAALQKIDPTLGFDIMGRIEPGIQNVTLQENVEKCGYVWDEIYKGEFLSKPHDTIPGRYVSPVADYLFNWSCSMIGRGNACNLAPRIELTTIEAWQQGTIPILFEETVPDYIPKDAYISLTWLNINTVRKDIDSEAAKVLDQMRTIQSKTPEQLHDICKNALESTMSGWGVECNYQSFLDSVKE
ncbi:hypothetical protein NVP1031O_022 [Vibrio phage 1.031.O._10N.261.46.F8]|nr:hypothetical protein NVP1031O_022 [Vibrio phage 1.031.O._10N.261.46.F8]